jgi:hypothetical protein
MADKEELHVVTEQGMYGDLEVKDPSKRKLKEEEMEALIEKATQENLKNL